jgi:hypothetical protein
MPYHHTLRPCATCFHDRQEYWKSVDLFRRMNESRRRLMLEEQLKKRVFDMELIRMYREQAPCGAD